MDHYITSYLAIALGILLTMLAINVSRLRIVNKISVGDGGNKALIGAIRAHANAVETVPIMLILFLIFELQGGSKTLLIALGAIFVIARFLHALGMTLHIFILRRWSMAVSYVLGLVLPVLLVLQI